MEPKNEVIESLLGKEVVVDTKSIYMYIGTLQGVDNWFYTLSDVDVHDCSQAYSSKEIYVMEARKFGIKKNREAVYIRKNEVVSISKLEDVIQY